MDSAKGTGLRNGTMINAVMVQLNLSVQLCCFTGSVVDPGSKGRRWGFEAGGVREGEEAQEICPHLLHVPPQALSQVSFYGGREKQEGRE
jgi:hypothetical protein